MDSYNLASEKSIGSEGYGMSHERVQYLDIAKGIAIICIVIGHNLGIPAVGHVVFTFHVPIFYFITGYLMNRNSSVSDFVKRRSKRLLLPYLYTSLVMIVVTAAWNWMAWGGGAA